MPLSHGLVVVEVHIREGRLGFGQNVALLDRPVELLPPILRQWLVVALAAEAFLRHHVAFGDGLHGEWVKEQPSSFDADRVKFSFYMKDDANRVAKVVLDGAKPNNFELATSVVAKGKFVNGEFHASEVLTKCPSKYEGTSETVKKTL